VAIAFNNSADLGGSDSISSLTVAYTLGSGSNLLIVVVDGDASVDDVTGVTYAGVSMSLAWRTAGIAGHYDSLSMWYLLGPTSGANNVVVSASTSHRIRAIAADYTGVKQSGQPDATSSGSFNITGQPSYTNSVTTVADNSWAIAAFVGYNGNLPATAGTGSTRRVFGAFYGMPSIFDSNGPITPAGSYSMTINSPADVAEGGMRIASFSPDIVLDLIGATVICV
jgi:hypothetical protein